MSEITEKDKRHVWHPFTQHKVAGDPLEIVRAAGVHLFDAEGNSYIDANSSWWVNTHGHAHPHIGKALNDQFFALEHTVFAGVTHPKAAELAERISGKLPDPLNRVFFSDNGSTAVEIAMKMAIQYWSNQGINKEKFVALSGSYHGDTFGAMSVGQRGYFNKPFEPLFFEAHYLDFPGVDYSLSIEQAKEYFSKGDVAAVIVEPLVQGAAGMQMYSVEFLNELTRLAKEHNVLVIFDEVMTGFGRTGKLFSLDYCDQAPDFVAMSKGLTAGVMALGLTVATDEIFEAFLGDDAGTALLHGHSFTANPLACAVACANLDLFEEEHTWEGIRAIEGWNNEFKSELSALDKVQNIRITGTIIAFEIGDSGSSYFSDIKTKAYKHFLNDGILLRPLGNTIFVNPPFTITKAQYDQVKSSILDLIKSL